MLEKLIEKKDLLAYLNFRMALLEVQMQCAMDTAPEKDREFIRQRFIGRLRELERLRIIIEQLKLKEEGKKAYRKHKELNKKINGNDISV